MHFDKILFVINKVSGSGKENWRNLISNYFTEKSSSIEFFELPDNPDAEKIRNSIKTTKPQLVVAVGGDGTVSLVALALRQEKIPMAIIPAGSANGMAAELNIPNTAEEALDVISTGEVRSCDAIKIGDRYCLHLSDIGLNAQLIKYFSEGKLRGKLGYARVILKTLWRRKKIQVSIKAREEIKREAFMIVLANASKYGTGAVINPEGRINDGLFEVVIVRQLSISQLLKMLFRPGPFNPTKIETHHASSVSISTRSRVHFQIDGEYLGKVTHIEAAIEKNFVDLVLPMKARDK
jgi:diacylglycerol kinase family enzyme